MYERTDQQPTVRTTIRKRKDKKFIAYFFSSYPTQVEDILAELEEHIPDVFTTFEHQPVTLPNGKQISRKHVLWVPPDDLDKYKAWQAEQQRLSYLALQKKRELTLDSLTLDEVLQAMPSDAPIRQERPTPRPFVPPKKPKPEREPPPWINMPSVIRDGNGNEYHWNTLATTKPEVTPEITCQPETQELPSLDADISAQTQAHQADHVRSLPTNHKGITRYEYAKYSQCGYRANVTWKRTQQTKYFSDKRYGDRLAALDAAITWRNDTEKKLGKPRTEVRIVGNTRSNTGYQGIYQMVKEGKYNVFEVHWLDGDGKKHMAQVSIDKWGRREALKRAKRIRLAKWKERIRSKEGKKF